MSDNTLEIALAVASGISSVTASIVTCYDSLKDNANKFTPNNWITLGSSTAGIVEKSLGLTSSSAQIQKFSFDISSIISKSIKEGKFDALSAIALPTDALAVAMHIKDDVDKGNNNTAIEEFKTDPVKSSVDIIVNIASTFCGEAKKIADSQESATVNPNLHSEGALDTSTTDAGHTEL